MIWLVLSLLSLLLLPAQAWAAIAVVQTTSVSGAGVSSASTAPDITTTNGNLIVCSIFYFTFNAFTSITDADSNVYSTSISEITGSTSSNSHAQQKYSNVITGSATANFTATFTGNSSFDLHCTEISGQATGSVLDKTATKVDNSGTSHTSSSTATTDQTNELLMGGGSISLYPGSDLTFTATGSFTEQESITAQLGVTFGSITASRVVSGTAAYAFTFTSDVSDSGIMGMISTWRELVVAPTVRRRAPMTLQ